MFKILFTELELIDGFTVANIELIVPPTKKDLKIRFNSTDFRDLISVKPSFELAKSSKDDQTIILLNVVIQNGDEITVEEC